MELTNLLSLLAVVLPVAYGAPTQAANSLHPEILKAMQRDLGLNAEQAVARMASDHEATQLISKLTDAIHSDKFAGGWIDATKTYIGVTDEAAAEQVKAAGAVPVVVKTSLAKLEAAKQAMDNHLAGTLKTRDGAKPDLTGIASYFVDVASNKLVVEALDNSQDRAHKLAALGSLADSEYEVRTVKSLPSAAASVIGGNAYVIDSKTRCSYGFAVSGGFVSAGHCGKTGSKVTAGGSVGGENVGTFAGSTFPGNDFSYVKTISGVSLPGKINNYNGGTIAVKGSQEAAQGASVCRSGSTTGVRCGTITGKGQTVVLDGVNTVNNLSRSSACCDHGDSGGSFYSGGQGQGVTSATNGGCSDGGYSYFQPLNPILSHYGVSLITS